MERMNNERKLGGFTATGDEKETTGNGAQFLVRWAAENHSAT